MWQKEEVQEGTFLEVPARRMEFMEFVRRMGNLGVFPVFAAYMLMVVIVPRFWKRLVKPMELRLVRKIVN